MTPLDDRERFLGLCAQIRRSGISDLLNWLDGTDFYTAPASTRFHLAESGGLLKHSLHVYDELQRLIRAYPELKVLPESAVITSLFHDLCKVNFYTVEKRNRKNAEGKWESYDAYAVREKFCFGGHGSKSVFLIQHFLPLTPEEAVAINCHMGGFSENPKEVMSAYEQFPLAWLLHAADEAAAFVVETKHE